MKTGEMALLQLIHPSGESTTIRMHVVPRVGDELNIGDVYYTVHRVTWLLFAGTDVDAVLALT